MSLWATGGSVNVVDETAPEAITIHAVGSPGKSRFGDAAEAEFIARACALDFRIAKPWGNTDPYDVLVGIGRGFWRVQVKISSYFHAHAYRIKNGGLAGPYTKDNIDFIAAHVLPDDLWYIVPVEAFEDGSSLYFNPRSRRNSKYEKYREAWCLLACDPKARGWKDVPVLCRCKDLPVRCEVCPKTT